MHRHLRRAVTAGVATAALVLGLDYATFAATGHSLILGRDNSADRTTTLTRTTNGPTLAVRSRNYMQAPFEVNGKRMVEALNADRVDNLHGADLQRRLTEGCPGGQALADISEAGEPVCVAVAPAEALRFTSGAGPFQEARTFAVGRLDPGDYQVSLTASAETSTSGTSANPVSLECVLLSGTAPLAVATAVNAGNPHELTLSATRLVTIGSSSSLSVRCEPNGTTIWTWQSVPLTVSAVVVQPPAAFPAGG